jgi:hypothetical protein
MYTVPKYKPANPPAANKLNAWVSNGNGKLSEHRAVITPVVIPIMPNALPTLDVACDARPVIPPMQAKLAAK